MKNTALIAAQCHNCDLHAPWTPSPDSGPIVHHCRHTNKMSKNEWEAMQQLEKNCDGVLSVQDPYNTKQILILGANDFKNVGLKWHDDFPLYYSGSFNIAMDEKQTNRHLKGAAITLYTTDSTNPIHYYQVFTYGGHKHNAHANIIHFYPRQYNQKMQFVDLFVNYSIYILYFFCFPSLFFCANSQNLFFFVFSLLHVKQKKQKKTSLKLIFF